LSGAHGAPVELPSTRERATNDLAEDAYDFRPRWAQIGGALFVAAQYSIDHRLALDADRDAEEALRAGRDRRAH
jgi:hypothetical protein